MGNWKDAIVMDENMRRGITRKEVEQALDILSVQEFALNDSRRTRDVKYGAMMMLIALQLVDSDKIPADEFKVASSSIHTKDTDVFKPEWAKLED